VVLIGSFVVMAGAGLWFPRGSADVNHIAIPVLLLPAIWAALFFYTYLDRSLLRAWLITTAIVGGHAVLITWHLMAGGA